MYLSKPTNGPGWPITNRSRRRSGLWICCFRTVSRWSLSHVLSGLAPSRAGSLLQLIAFPCRSELAREGGRTGDNQSGVSMTSKIPEPDLGYLQKVLLEMLAIPSPTGFTDTIVRYVAERLEELGIPFELTRRGTIRATL